MTALKHVGRSLTALLQQSPIRPGRDVFTASPIHTVNTRHYSTPTMTVTSDWNTNQYLKFNNERTRPARDLLAQIPLASPKHVVDIGCGPGNSTEQLVSQYPNARIIGVDSSPNMLVKARAALPNITFTLGDLRSYSPTERVDLYFSNAVFQWVPDAERIPVIARLLETLPSGGVFAFQVPDNFLEPSHVAMRETAVNGPWAASLQAHNPLRAPFPSPQRLYDELKPLVSKIDLWHSQYHHVLDDHKAIVEWVKGTGLRPFIDPLSDEHREQFLKEYLDRITQVYPLLHDGKVMLRYPRLFMVAVRA
jgi:trans-aconitate 2-methyltransferase